MYDLNSLSEKVKKLDALVGTEVLDFLYEVYDSERGAFYYTKSGSLDKELLPDIEASYFSILTLEAGGIFKDGYPDFFKNKLASWIKEKQSEEDGYFYLPQWGKTSGSRRDRDLNFALEILKRLGEKPLYKTPHERFHDAALSANMPVYLTSEEEFIKWLDSMSFENASIWATGNTISSAADQIKSAGLLDCAREYVLKKQNKETGLFGDGLNFMNSNGTMKLSFLFDEDFKFPNLYRAVESIINIIKNTEIPSDVAITFIWNPFVALNNIKASYKALPEDVSSLIYDNADLLIDFAYNNALLFKREDGGFSEYPDKGLPVIQGNAKIGDGRLESDLDGTVIASARVRESVYELFGIENTKDYYAPCRKEFLEKLKNKPAIIK